MSKITVVLGDKLSGKHDVATGYLTIKDLVSRKEVDTYDPEDRDSGGYQRMVSTQRVKTLAKDFQRMIFMYQHQYWLTYEIFLKVH